MKIRKTIEVNLKNIWARNQNSNKNEFWFYENEFKYINKKKWNEIHFIIPLLQPPNTPSTCMGVAAFTGSNKVKRPVGSTETWAQEFWPNGPTIFLCF